MALTPHSCFNSATHRLRAFFFFNDTATTEIYTLSLHDALPISNKHFFIKDAKNPYVEDKPFTWIQGDQVGGKSLIWGRQVYRWSDLDFEANLKDGHGVDWPLRYADIAPWYSYVERFIGVSGEKLG